MRRMNFVLALVCVFGLALLCCAPQKEELNMEQVRVAIEQANLKFGELVRQGDSAAIAELYTEDATLMPDQAEMIKGKQGIATYFGAGLQMGIKNVVLTTVDLSGSGDYAYEIGKVAMTIQPEGQEEPIEQTAKYVVVWKRTAEGAWKLHVDIWNSIAPAQ
jgi:uncharacterized protein (TIGR02246 family)